MLDFGDVNWLAVLVAGLASFVLGSVWYIALAKAWMAELGLTREQIDAQQRGSPARMYIGYAGAFVTYLVAAAAIALIVVAMGAGGAVDGLIVGLVVGIGVVATTQANTYSFGQRSLRLYLIDVGYTVLALAISGVIIGVWR